MAIHWKHWGISSACKTLGASNLSQPIYPVEGLVNVSEVAMSSIKHEGSGPEAGSLLLMPTLENSIV